MKAVRLVVNDGVPIRTCIGCRGRAPRSELLRTVVVDGDALPDPTAQAPGRGAWLHRSMECLTVADQRGAFRRVGASRMDQVRSLIEDEVVNG